MITSTCMIGIFCFWCCFWSKQQPQQQPKTATKTTAIATTNHHHPGAMGQQRSGSALLSCQQAKVICPGTSIGVQNLHLILFYVNFSFFAFACQCSGTSGFQFHLGVMVLATPHSCSSIAHSKPRFTNGVLAKLGPNNTLVNALQYNRSRTCITARPATNMGRLEPAADAWSYEGRPVTGPRVEMEVEGG